MKYVARSYEIEFGTLERQLGGFGQPSASGLEDLGLPVHAHHTAALGERQHMVDRAQTNVEHIRGLPEGQLVDALADGSSIPDRRF